MADKKEDIDVVASETVDIEAIPEPDEVAARAEALLAEAQLTAEASAEYDEKEVIRAALDTALKAVPNDVKGNLLCPWCGFKASFEKKEQQRSLRMHMESQHSQALFAYYLNPLLGFNAYSVLMDRKKKEDDMFVKEAQGLDITDELDDFDYLDVPADLKRKVDRVGGRLFWATEANLDRFEKRGIRPVDKSQYQFKHNHNHEGALIKANELVLVYVPTAIKERRERLKRLRVEQQAEGLLNAPDEKKLDDLGRQVFDYHRGRGMPEGNAMKVANAAMQKAASATGGRLPAKEGGWQEGTHSYVVHGGKP